MLAVTTGRLSSLVAVRAARRQITASASTMGVSEALQEVRRKRQSPAELAPRCSGIMQNIGSAS